MADQMRFIQLDCQAHAPFRNQFKQIIALANCPLDSRSFNLCSCGKRLHLASNEFCRLQSRNFSGQKNSEFLSRLTRYTIISCIFIPSQPVNGRNPPNTIIQPAGLRPVAGAAERRDSGCDDGVSGRACRRAGSKGPPRVPEGRHMGTGVASPVIRLQAAAA